MIYCRMPSRRVLVIEDDVDTQTILVLAFSTHGYIVSTASNGHEGLIAARRQPPDVILLDLAMPVLDGFGFRTSQLKDPALASIPVICVSGRHDASEVARRMGIDRCLPKPFDLEVMLEEVARLLVP